LGTCRMDIQAVRELFLTMAIVLKLEYEFIFRILES
jgi:hypothetical protein